MTDSLQEIAGRFGLRRSGTRHIGPCPKCGGSSTTDKFVLFADGGFKCFACDFKGDRIKWLRDMEGLSCKQAHDQEGIGCSVSCPHYGPCRDGQPVARRPVRSVSLPPSAAPASGVPVLHAGKAPDPRWQTWAQALLLKAKATLAHRPDDLSWLEARGIPSSLVDHFGLGWLAHDQRVKRADIGLPEVEGKDKLWIPAGLLIPVFDRISQIHRLRVRRTPESRERFLSERKYEWIRGSGIEPLCLGFNLAAPRGVVIVEAELDALAVASAHPAVVVIALGTVAGGLPEWQRRICDQAPVILVALDADLAADGGSGAGPKAVQRWAATFRQAKFWPVPAGKDPGDYVKDHGGDLHAWVEAGLPPTVAQKAPIPPTAAPLQDSSFSPDSRQRGEGGECQKGVEEYRILTLTDGTEICVTSDKDLWIQLSDEGQIVFSDHELERLKMVLAGMGATERIEAVGRVVDAKRVFGSAYICRGEMTA
jgi:DNA primase